MIKTLIFDLGGVIVPLDFPAAYAAIGAISPHPAGEIRERIIATGLVDRLELGHVAPEAFAREMSAALGLELPYDRFCELWSGIFPPHTLTPDELLAELHGRYRLLLLSNTNAIHFTYVKQRYPILRHFDDYVLSYELGVMKPDAAIYEAAVAKAGCRPEECFFTDDGEVNVDGARRAGIDAVQFLSVEKLREDLRARAILS